MKTSILLASVALIALGCVARAEEYYVVHGPNHQCTIVTTRPDPKETITQTGPLAWPLPFKSRVDAEDHIKQTKECGDPLGALGSSSIPR